MNVGHLFIPGNLSFGKMAGPFFYVVNRCGEITLACQIFCHLPVSKAFHGKAARGNASFQQSPDLFFQTCFQHPVNTLVDSFIQKIPFHGKSENRGIVFQFMLLFLRDTVPGQSSLQRADHPADIIGVQRDRCGRIFPVEPVKQLSTSLLLRIGFQIRGLVRGFDNFTVIIENDGKQQLVYKHAVSTISPAANITIMQPEKAEKKE